MGVKYVSVINLIIYYSMKKTITLNAVIIFLMVLFVEGLYAQDLLVKYTFNGGSLSPSYVADGVQAGDLGKYGTQVTYTTSTKETRECLVVNNNNTTIGTANCLYLPIGPQSGKKMRIVKTIITHRKATGNTTTNNIRSYLYAALGSASSNNLIYSGTGGYPLVSNNAWLVDQTFLSSTGGGVVAPIDIDATYYASLSVNRTSAGTSPSEWWIDEIAYYGYVFAEGDVIMPVNVDFGDYNTLNLTANSNFNLQGFNIADNLTLAIEGADAGLFSLNQYSYTASEINTGVTVTASYTPTTYDAPVAKIKVTYGTVEKYINLLGTVPVLFETFDTKDTTGLINGSPLSDISNYTVLAGWSMENVTKWHKSGTYAFTPALISNVDTIASISTPPLDLSKPFKVSMLGKRLNNNNNGESYLLVDTDTIFYYDNPNNSFRLITVDGYIAGENSNIHFEGKGVANNQVGFDNITINYTNSPALSLPYSSLQNFGNKLPGVSSTINIPVKAYNLSGDLSVSAPANSVFELLSGTTITKAAAETGTNIQVKFTPSAYESYTDKITVNGGGLLLNGLSVDRTVYLSGVGSISTGTENLKTTCKIVVEGQVLKTSVIGGANLEVFSITGHMLIRKTFTDNTQLNLEQGAYLVKVRDSKGITIQKVLVN